MFLFNLRFRGLRIWGQASEASKLYHVTSFVDFRACGFQVPSSGTDSLQCSPLGILPWNHKEGRILIWHDGVQGSGRHSSTASSRVCLLLDEEVPVLRESSLYCLAFHSPKCEPLGLSLCHKLMVELDIALVIHIDWSLTDPRYPRAIVLQCLAIPRGKSTARPFMECLPSPAINSLSPTKAGPTLCLCLETLIPDPRAR